MADDLLEPGPGTTDADASGRHAFHQLDRDGGFVEVRGRKGHEHVIDVLQDLPQPGSRKDPEVLDIRSLQKSVLCGLGPCDPQVDRKLMRLRVFREAFEDTEPGPRLEATHVEATGPVPAAVPDLDQPRLRAISQD